MTKEDTNKIDKGTGQGNQGVPTEISKNELKEVLSANPLTVEQQVAQLSKQVANLSLGFDEVLGLLKTIVKNQGDTGVMIENMVPKIDKNIAKVSKQVENITPTKDKIVNTIFSGKNMGGLESTTSSSVQKVNMNEYVQTIEDRFRHDRYSPENFNDKPFEKISFEDKKETQVFMLYCMNVFLNLKNEGIKIEDRERKDISGNMIFCTGQGCSWTINDIEGIIKNYYGTKYSTQNILEYILYLHKKYILRKRY